VTTRYQAVVVGGGISGLVCAHALRKSGIDACVLEASSRPGGVIQSVRRDGFLVELGPQSFSSTAPIHKLCEELEIAGELRAAPAKAPRYVLVGGRLQPVPLTPPAFFTSSLIDGATKWGLLRDIFGKSVPPPEDESVADFIRRKFSQKLLDRLVGPFVSGIYAGDPERLSVRSAFPQLYEAEQTAGSVIRGVLRGTKKKQGAAERPTLSSFANGVGTLVEALASRLGSSIRYDVEVRGIRCAETGAVSRDKQFLAAAKSASGEETIVSDFLVIAAPTDIAARLLTGLHADFVPPLEAIAYAPVAVVSLGYEKEAVGYSLDGFGFLIPRSEGLRTLGTVWNSSLFAGRAPAGRALLTSFIGGATDPTAANLPLDELVATVHREISGPLSVSKPPVFSNVQLYQRAIPQYNFGHAKLMARLEATRKTFPSLGIVGNYSRGPSIGACVEQALAVAADLSQRGAARAN
jgi:protoporphyrinogen/coproporphyrinogen III oxidase